MAALRSISPKERARSTLQAAWGVWSLGDSLNVSWRQSPIAWAIEWISTRAVKREVAAALPLVAQLENGGLGAGSCAS